LEWSDKMGYIRWFHEIHASDLELVGGKGANLGEMTAAGLPVPPGFCLTAQTYREFIAVTGLDEMIHAILDRVDPQDAAALDASCGRIRDLITDGSRTPYP
jgi:pyruvate,water dikinase